MCVAIENTYDSYLWLAISAALSALYVYTLKTIHARIHPSARDKKERAEVQSHTNKWILILLQYIGCKFSLYIGEHFSNRHISRV